MVMLRLVLCAALMGAALASSVCVLSNNATNVDGTFNNDASRPFAQGIFGEVAHVYATKAAYDRANELDAVMFPNPIENIFSPYSFNSEFQRFRTFFYDDSLGEVETMTEFLVRYHQTYTTAIKSVGKENFLLLANRTRCWKRNPFRPSQISLGRISPDMKKTLADLYGPIDGEFGCDWGAHAYYAALRGEGAVMEFRVVPTEGFSDMNSDAWLVAHADGGVIRWRVETYLPGFVFGLPDPEIFIIDVRFHERGYTHWETQKYTPEFLAILQGFASAKKRSAPPAAYLPYILNAAGDLITEAAQYKASFPQYAAGVDWIVAQAAAARR